MGSVFFIALRRLRLPLILIILIYAISIVGLVLIPGQSSNGDIISMSFFEAFYFVSYTATTIGFGEVPNAFTNTQRLWVTFIIYSSVVGWAYLIGGLLRLANDHAFQQAIVSARFARTVKYIRDPFYIVCGLGETGRAIVNALDRLGIRSVVVDSQEHPLDELHLEDLTIDPPSLVGDASQPDILISAGILKKECRGVIILSQNDQVNLAISVACKFLHPTIDIICRAYANENAALMRQIAVTHVINPFEIFSHNLLMALLSPNTYRLVSWMTGLPGTKLQASLPAPPGRWIVCGYGRFGSIIVPAIKSAGYEIAVVDPDETEIEGVDVITGNGIEQASLQAAGIAMSQGIVCGTDNDTDNLLIYLTSQQLNPNIFTILRQNFASNEKLFKGSSANMVMISRQIITSECIAIIKTPLLSRFVGLVQKQDDQWSAQLIGRLQALLGDHVPEFWSLTIDQKNAPGIIGIFKNYKQSISIKELCRDIKNSIEQALILVMMIERKGEYMILPSSETLLLENDQILFASTQTAKANLMHLSLNINVARSVITGTYLLGGAVFRVFDNK